MVLSFLSLPTFFLRYLNEDTEWVPSQIASQLLFIYRQIPARVPSGATMLLQKEQPKRLDHSWSFSMLLCKWGN